MIKLGGALDGSQDPVSLRASYPFGRVAISPAWGAHGRRYESARRPLWLRCSHAHYLTARFPRHSKWSGCSPYLLIYFSSKLFIKRDLDQQNCLKQNSFQIPSKMLTCRGVCCVISRRTSVESRCRATSTKPIKIISIRHIDPSTHAFLKVTITWRWTCIIQ